MSQWVNNSSFPLETSLSSRSFHEMEVPVPPTCYHEFTEYRRAFIKKENCGNCQQQLLAKDSLKLYLCFRCNRLFCSRCRDEPYGIALSFFSREDEYGSSTSKSRDDYLGEETSSLRECCEVPCQKLPQKSKPLCLRSRAPGAKNDGRAPFLDQFEEAQLFYQEDALGSQLCYRDGRGKEKRVSPEKLLLQSSLFKERLIPTGDRVQRVRSVG